MNDEPTRLYQFADFSVDANKRLLRRAGEVVPLPPKVFDTLLVFVENRGQVLTKDMLLGKIWVDTIVEEGGLARNISILRKALGERPDDHQYIITVPGRGYQWVAAVKDAQTVSDNHEQPLKPALKEKLLLRAVVLPHRWQVLGALGALTFGIAVYVLMQIYFPPYPHIESIAVLPLENLSGDPSRQYLADGMTEGLINSLAQVRSLRVVSRTSVMRFKGSRKPLSEIAQELDVDALISGSFHQDNGRVKITIQLIHGPTDRHLWASEYERELPDILKLHSDVARAVVEEIRIQVTPEDAPPIRPTASVNPDAYEEYLKGRYFLWKYIEEDRMRAIDHFERSIKIDPHYAPAYAGLSHAWWTLGVLGPLELKDVQSPARRAAEKALELDDRLAEAYAAKAYLQGIFEWDWSGSDKTMQKALALNANSLDVHYVYAMILMAQGRLSEAKIQIENAAQLDPLSAQVQSSFGRILYRARKFDEATLRLKQAIELEPRNSSAIQRLADVYVQMGRHADAIALYAKALSTGDSPRAFKVHMAQVYAHTGRQRDARQLLGEIKSDAPVVAQIMALLGDKDEAFQRLFRSIGQRNDWLIFIKAEPLLDSLHSDPRWIELLQQMNLSAELS